MVANLENEDAIVVGVDRQVLKMLANLRSPDAVRRMIVAATSPGITAFADSFRLRKD